MSNPTATTPSATEVLSSLSQYVRADAGLPAKAPAEKPDWKTFAFLLVFAFDVTAVFWLIGSLFDSLFSELLLKSLPGVMGVVLVTYTDALRKLLVEFARKPWFRVVVSLFFLFVVLPVFAPYHVRLRIPAGATTYLDGKVVSPQSVNGDEKQLRVSGFRRHVLAVGEFDTKRKERIDTFVLGPRALLRARLRGMSFDLGPAPHFALDLATLHPKPLLADTTMALFGISGVFPDLYLATAPERYDVVRLRGDTHEVRVIHKRGTSETVYLPAGRYHFRYLSVNNCWSAPIPDSVSRTKLNDVDLVAVKCQ